MPMWRKGWFVYTLDDYWDVSLVGLRGWGGGEVGVLCLK